MPNIKSAAKRMRQNVKHRLANRARRSLMRTAMKKVHGLLAEGKTDDAATQLPTTLSIIGKTAQKGLLHKNTAARYASRLTKKLNAAAKKTE